MTAPHTVLPPEILTKYNVSGPRYTSYPSAPVFSDKIQTVDYISALKDLSKNKPPLSLYFHIPFCHSLCNYCGCNVAIRKDRPEYGDQYLNYLFKEMDKVVETTGSGLEVSQCHWGGGTPTFLTTDQIRRLHNKTKTLFHIKKNAEVAIEIEPRTVTEEQISTLAELGFNRISMGVQDMDEKVGKAINRINSFERIQKVFQMCRKYGFQSINVDLIYGLPEQNLESFTQTIQSVITLKPNRIALYSFAYVPWLKRHQQKINPESLPNPEERLALFNMASQSFQNGPYQAIAMDHFALEEDEMAIAFGEGRLNRNFMGYTVLPGEDFLGMGVSSIGYIQGRYFQNQKHIPEYFSAIDQNHFPLERGYILTEDDKIRKWVIQSLMCRFQIQYSEFQERFGHEFGKYFEAEQNHLTICKEDGLLKLENNGLQLTDMGKLLVRNICMGMDAYYLEQRKTQRFSKTI